MELPSEEGEMPIPLNSSYGHDHMMHHHQEHHHHHSHHHHPTPPSSHSLIIPSPAAAAAAVDDDDHHHPFKKPTRYRECLKNHAAAMGGNATDGCGEFMPSGEDGTLEALSCSACNCHRNFHRKETDGEPASCDNCYVNPRMGGGRKLFVGHHNALGYHHHHHAGAAGALISSRAVAPHPMLMSYNMGGGGGSDQSDEHDGGGAAARPPHQVAKKRFRTKFTAEQKEKMLNFAEKVGWKIQKQEEAVVQQFCQEVGVKRRVLKVWMHNNKHNLAKKNLQSQSDDAQTKFD